MASPWYQYEMTVPPVGLHTYEALSHPVSHPGYVEIDTGYQQGASFNFRVVRGGDHNVKLSPWYTLNQYTLYSHLDAATLTGMKVALEAGSGPFYQGSNVVVGIVNP